MTGIENLAQMSERLENSPKLTKQLTDTYVHKTRNIYIYGLRINKHNT